MGSQAQLHLHGVTAVHIGQYVPESTAGETAETRLRPTTSAPNYSFVVLVEGIGIEELEAATPEVVDLAVGAGGGATGEPPKRTTRERALSKADA
jgi:hypothetical protein